MQGHRPSGVAGGRHVAIRGASPSDFEHGRGGGPATVLCHHEMGESRDGQLGRLSHVSASVCARAPAFCMIWGCQDAPRSTGQRANS